MSSAASAMDVGAGQIIQTPHTHDVLCGRGGLSNLHAGNEWFRRLVRSNRPLYQSCPKHTKLLVAKAIVQAVQQQDPPGRFLETADKEKGTWRQITYKRCVDKTSQALREKDPPSVTTVPGANQEAQPSISKEAAVLVAKAKTMDKDNADLADLAKAALRQAGLEKDVDAPRRNQVESQRKRKTNSKQNEKPFVKPPWWGQRIPIFSGYDSVQEAFLGGVASSVGQSRVPTSPPNKRIKSEMDDSTALPLLEPMQSRQSSIFSLFNGSGIFGRSYDQAVLNANQLEMGRNRPSSGFFSFSVLPRRNFIGQMSMPNPSDLISMEAAAFQGINTTEKAMYPGFASIPQQQHSLNTTDLDPLPFNDADQEVDHINNIQEFPAPQSGMYENLVEMPPFNIAGQEVDHINNGQEFPAPQGVMHESAINTPPGNADDVLEHMPTVDEICNATSNDMVFPPPTTRLTTQVSDWLTSFFPTNKEQTSQQQEVTPPPPPAENLERSLSSTFFNLVRSPSQFLTTLKSGVTSMVFGTDDFALIPAAQSNLGIAPPEKKGSCTLMGSASVSRPDSLLDDYEETPSETRLRSVAS